MMRPFSILCMLLAIGSGLYLYRTKYRAQMLDREIHATLKSADDARARAGLLRADYALLNDPIRLQELVDEHLTLKTTAPTQFTTQADFERRLPAIGLPPPEPPPEPEIPAAVVRPPPPEPKVAEIRPAEPKPVEAPRPPPVVVAAPPPPPRPAPPPVVAAKPPTPLFVPAPVAAPTPQLAIRTPPPVQAPPPRAPVTQVSLPQAAAPMASANPAANPAASAAARGGTSESTSGASSAPAPVFRSSLGMARRLPSLPAGSGGGQN